MAKRLDSQKAAEAALKRCAPRRSFSVTPPPSKTRIPGNGNETGKGSEYKIGGKASPKVRSGTTNDGQVCGKQVIKEAMGSIKCDTCLEWFHVQCEGLNIKQAGAIRDMKILYVCQECKKFVPDFRQVVSGGKMHTVGVANIAKELEKVGQKIKDMEETIKAGAEKSKIEAKTTCLKVEEVVGKVLEKVEKEMKENKEKLTIVKETLATNEMASKSYADVLKKTMNEKMDQMAVHSKPPTQAKDMVQECFDHESRKCNVVISNIPEAQGAGIGNQSAADKQAVYELCHMLHLEVVIVKAVRLGAKSRDGRPRLLLVSNPSEETKWDVVRAAKNLKQIEQYKDIYVNPDMTRTEREEKAKLRVEARDRRNKGEDVFIFKGKVVVRTQRPAREAQHQATAQTPKQLPEQQQQVEQETAGAVGGDAAVQGMHTFFFFFLNRPPPWVIWAPSQPPGNSTRLISDRTGV